jgi:hypothetical protein
MRGKVARGELEKRKAEKAKQQEEQRRRMVAAAIRVQVNGAQSGGCECVRNCGGLVWRQALMRIGLAKQEMRRLRLRRREEHYAALTIQRLWRGHATRIYLRRWKEW